MGYVPGVYFVRVKVEDKDSKGGHPFHAAQAIAREIAQHYPGLTVEVAEDKVWSSVTARHAEGSKWDARTTPSRDARPDASST
jgi:hypothetical protein